MIPFNKKQQLPKISIIYNCYKAVSILVVATWAFLFQSIGQLDLQDMKEAGAFVEQRPLEYLLVSAAVIFLLLLVSYLDWKSRFFIFNEHSFSAYSGILKKSEKHIPYEKIQTVTQSANLLMRVLGLTSLSIETAAGSRNTAINLKPLKKQKADLIVSQIQSLRSFVEESKLSGNRDLSWDEYVQGNVLDEYQEFVESILNAGDRNVEAEGTCARTREDAFDTTLEKQRILRLSNFELIGAGLDSANILRTGAFSLVAFLGALGYLAPILKNAMSFLIGEGFMYEQSARLDSMINALANADTHLMFAFIVFAVLLFIAYIVAFFILKLIGAIISYAGFTLVRDENSFSVERGLFSRARLQIPLEKIQSLEIYEPFILAKLGYCQVKLAKIDSAKEKEEGKNFDALSSQGALLLHPFLKRSKLESFVNDFIPEYKECLVQDSGEQEQPVLFKLPYQAFKRAFVREYVLKSLLFWLLCVCALVLASLGILREYLPIESLLNISDPNNVLAILASFLSILAAFYLLMIIIGMYDAHLLQKSSSLTLLRHGIVFVKGGLNRTTCLIERRKMQSIEARANCFQQRKKLATFRIKSAQSLRGGTINITDLRYSDTQRAVLWFERR